MSSISHWVVEDIVRPIVVLIGSVTEKLYNAFFRERAIRGSIKRDEQLASDIRRELAFLFSDYSAVIVPIDKVEALDVTTKHPHPFDWAYSVVALDDLVFKFFKGRGDLSVWVAGRRNLKSWGELPSVLHWLGWRRDLGEPRSFMSLEDLAEVLRPRMEVLREAYSDRMYSQMEQRISNAREEEKATAHQMSVELNQRLSGRARPRGGDCP